MLTEPCHLSQKKPPPNNACLCVRCSCPNTSCRDPVRHAACSLYCDQQVRHTDCGKGCRQGCEKGCGKGYGKLSLLRYEHDIVQAVLISYGLCRSGCNKLHQGTGLANLCSAWYLLVASHMLIADTLSPQTSAGSALGQRCNTSQSR